MFYVNFSPAFFIHYGSQYVNSYSSLSLSPYEGRIPEEYQV